MSDNRSHQSHKRQKSSALNINYYFPPPPPPSQQSASASTPASISHHLHTHQQHPASDQDVAQLHSQSINLPHSSPSHPNPYQTSSPDHYHNDLPTNTLLNPNQHDTIQQTPIQETFHNAYTYPHSEPPYTTASPNIVQIGHGSIGGATSSSATAAAAAASAAAAAAASALDPASVQSSPTFNQYPLQFTYPDVLYANRDFQQFAFPKPVQPLQPVQNVQNVQTHSVNASEYFYQGGSVPGSAGGSGSPLKSLPARRRIQHNKNNLSISSHFNLFNLKEEYEPTIRSLLQIHDSPSSLPTHLSHLASGSIGGGDHLHQHHHQQLLPAASIYTSAPTTASGGGIPTNLNIGGSDKHLIQSLLIQLPSIDGQNINQFLLDIIHRIANQLALDDFYNILYNIDDIIGEYKPGMLPKDEKIDSTEFNLQLIPENSSYTVSLILGVFKDPQSLHHYTSSIDPSQIKLTSVNYHELLRTFLAIKILSDILIQLDDDSTSESDHNIPRLSIYKTYYIICQKLISQYPSTSNSISEQQKIILGQSKLGKLIKLVYPNLKIKRLGSRGESKYNYLGVVWNDKLVRQDTKDLCEKNELSDLSTYFMLRKNKSKRKASGQLQNLGHTSLKSGGPLPTVTTGIINPNPVVNPQIPGHGVIGGDNDELINISHLPIDNHNLSGISLDHPSLVPGLSTSNANITLHDLKGSNTPGTKEQESFTFAPQLSFTNPFLKFPTFDDFSLAPDLDRESWFESIQKEQCLIVDSISINEEGSGEKKGILQLIDEIFILDLNENDENSNALLTNFMDKIITPYFTSILSKSEAYPNNIDLRIYLIIIIKLLPHLLLLTVTPVKGFQNHSSFLQTLRSSLLQFVNSYTDNLVGLESIFPHTNATIFCIMLKKLINVNDLLITFIKLIMKEEGFSSTRNNMKSDIQNYLISPSPSLSFENNEIRFNFKEDIVQNDLIFSLMGYNYNPIASELLLQQHQQFQHNLPDLGISGSGGNTNTSHLHQRSDIPSSVVSMKFVREEASLIEQFFKVDLVKFLSLKDSGHFQHNLPQDPSWTNLLSNEEFDTLVSLIKLMHESLLSTHFKSRYPILVYHNFISQILNDLLKHIYSKHQVRLQLQMQSSFGNWWVFNSFVEEYVGLMGEIVGLFQVI